MGEGSDRNRIVVSVRGLVEFILRSGDIDNRKKSGQDVQLMLEGARIHRMIQQRMGSNYHPEVALKKIINLDDYDIVIEGRADGIIFNEDNYVIDEIKTQYIDLDRIKEPVPVHLAQAKCYAFIFAEQESLLEITVRMTYVNQITLETKYFHETYTFGEIKRWFEDLVSRYRRWADFEFSFREIRNTSIHSVGFPFEYREGQKELAGQVYRTILHGKKLFIEAPTGVGKTVSTVFPTIKAMGEGLCDKIFYLTARTITRTVAADCFDILRRQGLKLKSVVITAKEKICPLESCECNPEGCERAKGHFDRINNAMYDLLEHEDSFTREVIEEYAYKHNVCPFEMCLDMSLFSDAVICDYNYVFDPNVYLRRFFADAVQGKYVFLVDEAHNLVDRGMDMYSAALYKEDFLVLKRLVNEADSRLARAFGSGNRKLLSLKRECSEYTVLEDISDIVMAFSRLMARLETFLDEQENFKDKEVLLDFYFRIRHFLNMYDNMGEHDYRIYCEHVRGGDFMLKLLCINPADSLKQRLVKAVSTVFFSATLLPIGYYKDMLGAETDDYAVYARSVFDEKKRGLFIARDVSSKYTRRNETEYHNIAEYISKIVAARAGNYMVFFPSHAFLYEVLSVYNEYFASDTVVILAQKQSMSEVEREEFLAAFTPGMLPARYGLTIQSLVGFCVMGGIFSEGIDLKNDSLIGAIIVGTGLPMVCNERKILKEAYELNGLDGFDYAYRFPGMNKVLQAAGRVIRTVDDVGVVALLDERFLTSAYLKLFPREWKRYEQMTLAGASDKLEEFWEGFGTIS
ncbi:MAG: ATP-dependent DNA helicase [Lachnospiraceae bacterium]|nr:ATP-dependent DNA helicase [Lachnospiraceae bacterium]